MTHPRTYSCRTYHYHPRGNGYGTLTVEIVGPDTTVLRRHVAVVVTASTDPYYSVNDMLYVRPEHLEAIV
jgi:D-serine deaminase-like pyridoxal phosphate-dependent protein